MGYGHHLILAAFLIWGCCGSALAQALPGSVDAGRIKERVHAIPLPHEEDPEVLLPKAETPEGLGKHFVVKQGVILRHVVIKVTNPHKLNTAIPETKLAASYREYLGQPIDITVLQQIADRITAQYNQAGYILSKAIVPEQTLTEGTATIVVVEGYVSRIRVEGAPELLKHDHFGIIQGAIKNLMAMRPLYGPGLEKQLLVLNDLGGAQVKAVLEALPKAEAAPGAVGMVLQFEQAKRLSNIEINNFGSRYSGPWQVTGGTTIGTPLMAFDALRLNGLVSIPLNEVKFFSGDYSVPLTASGLMLTFGGSYSNSEPDYKLKDKDINSDDWTTDISVSYPLIRSRLQNLSVSGKFDTSDTNTDALSVPLTHDRIRTARASASFDHQDNGGSNTALFTLSQGLNILNATETGSKDLSRSLGHSDFTKANLLVSRLQNFNADWQAYTSASGQYAWKPLVSAEEFGYGGQAFGRAYDPSEITGDSGLAGSLELRYHGFAPIDAVTLEPFGFYDLGKIWNVNSFKEGPNIFGSSVGLGLRFAYSKGVSGSFTAALPLIRPSYDPPSYSHPYGPRILLQTGITF